MKNTCLWCGKLLPKRRRKYCSDECSNKYFVYKIALLWWGNAVKMALERTGNKCEDCGSNDNLEVHHKIKLDQFENRHNSPKNSQDNLRVLCRKCHNIAHHSKKPLRHKDIPKEQLILIT